MKGIFHQSLRGKVLLMTILPIIVLALLIVGVSIRAFTSSMNTQVYTDMEKQCNLVQNFYDRFYPGAFSIVQGENGYRVYKGTEDITDDYSLLEGIKEAQDMDTTIFYQDVRVLTTIFDGSGNRCVDTVASPIIVKDVLNKESPEFYTSVIIGGVRNFAYYEPVFTEDGKCFGMIGISKPAQEVQDRVYRAVMPLILLCIAATVVIGFISVKYATGMVDDISKIEGFMKAVSEGNFTDSLDQKVLAQKDELGELGRIGVRMQKSIRELVEYDILTGLYNRRYGDTRAKQIKERSEKNGTSYCVAIADIDFFKKVNDTYGHDAGDVVLKQVAHVLKKSMVGKGFAARWGGEEFLLVFDMMILEEAVKVLESIMENIRELEIPVDEKKIHISVSIGVVQAESGARIDETLRLADEKLYYGKTNGRNRIVWE